MKCLLAFATTLFISHIAFASLPIKHTIRSGDHNLAVYEKRPAKPKRSILLIHGRTWSALPNFDLQVPGERLSVMDALAEKGYATYALDLPGYGDSPRDKSGWLTVGMAVTDIAATLQWIAQESGVTSKPALLGYSMGSTQAQLLAQEHPELISALIVYGYWRNLDIPIDQSPILARVVSPKSDKPLYQASTLEKAKEDFIIPGSISQKAIDAYATEALRTTPIRPDYKDVSDYAALDPKKVTIPTLIIQGEHDPVAPNEKQAKLFMRLGSGDRQWVVIPNTDHAAHLERPTRFVNAIVAFLER